MGFRFHRSLRLGPVRLNFGKTGATSISVGGRGAHMTFGRTGTRTTLGLPGTGLSYSAYKPYADHRTPRARPVLHAADEAAASDLAPPPVTFTSPSDPTFQPGEYGPVSSLVRDLGRLVWSLIRLAFILVQYGLMIAFLGGFMYFVYLLFTVK
jgi:Protein of unknown function (DUF4236)